MITASALIAKFQQALGEGWGYIWGESGAVWTQAKQDAATRDMTVMYGSRWIGKKVADCSGLFAWAFKQLGGSIYHGSNSIWNKYCTAQGTLTKGQALRPGTALFQVDSSGDRYHIGLYIGNDTVIEAKGTQYGVVTSKVSHWDEWGKLLGVDYSWDGEESAAPFAVLKNGSTGEAIKTLQENLLRLGYALPKYGADGKFGTETEKAIEAFQKAHGLTVDGKYGEATHEALMAALSEVPSNEQPAPTPDTPTPPADSTATTGRVIIVSDSGKVNIRKGNGTKYSRITQVAAGASFEHVATAANGWHAVIVSGQVGWVSGEYSRIM